MAEGLVRKLIVAVALLGVLSAFMPGLSRAEHIKIGSVKSTNVGPVYIAIDKGYFAAEGLDVELVQFQAASPIAVAAASGDVDFGTTSTSGALFSLAGQGTLRIIGGLYSEAPGFHNFALATSNRAWEAGLKGYKDLAGHSVAVTTVGSPVHYSLALIAEKFGIDLGRIRVLPLQSIPNMVSAIKGNQADATIINSTSINPVLEQGSAHLIGWIGDETPWQTAVAFTTPKMIATRKATVDAFLRAFKKGTRFYHDAYTGPDERPKDGPNKVEATQIIAKYTDLTPALVNQSIAYVDSDARIDVKDIAHQIEWFESQRMLKDGITSYAVLDKNYVEAMSPP